MGLINVPDVTTSGTSLDLSAVLAMRAAVSGANDTKLAWITTPAVRQVLAARQVFTGSSSALWSANQLDGRPAYVSPMGRMARCSWPIGARSCSRCGAPG